MKKIFLILLLGLALTCHNQAQNYSFVYDAAGNRTDRLIELLKSAITHAESDTSAFEAKHELINDVIAVIYPNPTRDDVFVSFGTYPLKMKTELLLFDNNGRLLNTVINPDNECSIGLSLFPVGYYYLIIKIEDKTSQWKIIKQ